MVLTTDDQGDNFMQAQIDKDAERGSPGLPGQAVAGMVSG
jgi:hypothetical protein